MKLPFTIKMPAIGGLLSRLNPKALLSKKESDEDDDLHEGEDHDLFGDLGDLDQLDAEALENGEGEDGAAGDRDDFGDFDDLEDDDDDEPDVLAEVDEDHGPAEFADLDDDEHAGGSGDGGADLVAEIMGDLEDFNIGDEFGGDEDEDEDEEEDEEAAQKAKLKKLGLLAGGGVAVAMLLGGVAWWLLGADSAPETVAEAPQEAAGPDAGVVISLDSLPPLPQKKSPPKPAARSTPEQPAEDGGILIPETAQMDGGGEEASDNRSELQKLGLDVQMEPGVGVVIPASTPTSYINLDRWPGGEPLSETPYAALVQQGDNGILPRIGEDGTTPFDAYRRPPPDMSGDAKVAVIVSGLGLSRAATEAAISAMPADVTLSLDVYSRGLDFWVKTARQDGHEVLLEMPGESSDFPFSDPGPSALQSLAAPEENLEKLHWILSQASGYFGVLSTYGSKFLTVEEQIKVVMDELKARGLMYVDGGAQDSLGARVAYGAGEKWAAVELVLDARPGRKALELQLAEFEALAKKRAQAVARISTDPISLQMLSQWFRTLGDKGLQLVPVSALANKQLIR